MVDGAEALGEWMADRVADRFVPPAPHGIFELRADATLADDFAGSPFVTSVPLR